MTDEQKKIILEVIEYLLDKGYGFNDLVDYIKNIHEQD